MRKQLFFSVICIFIWVVNGMAAPDITVEDIREHINYLADDKNQGRKAGTPESDAVAQYIADHFEKYGLSPVGDNGTYFQEFEFVADIVLGETNTMALHADPAIEYDVEQDFMPFTFTDNGEIEGEVVFAGYGISAPNLEYDDYADLDVTDKIVLVLRYHPDMDNPHSEFQEFAPFRRKAMTARENGAKGLLVVNGPLSVEEDKLIELAYEPLSERVGIGAAFVSQTVANQLLAAKGETLTDLQEKIDADKTPHNFAIPDVKLAMSLTVDEVMKTTKNVVGLFPGSNPNKAKEVLVVGAHYDHLGLGGHGSLEPEYGLIHNGADDNASGTSGVLELAEKVTANKGQFSRSILFMAFGAEEIGTLGSQYYVKNPILPLEDTVSMINMDMIGRLREDRAVIFGMGTASEWTDMIDKINESYALTLTYDQGGYGPSDHMPFYSKDIPVLFFFTGAHEDYHRASDDIEKLNYEGQKTLLDFIYETMEAIDTNDMRPTFVKVKEDENRKSSGGMGSTNVRFGIIPDYANDVEGLAITGAREDSPAGRAGLQGGDVIVQFNGKEIKDIYEFMYALQECVPGQEVEVVVMREGEEVKSMAVLEAK